jgi:hypothetical protein
MPTNDVGRRTAPNRAERRRSRGLMVPQRQRSQQDPSATFELQGFADSRGSDRYNRELARDRVEAMMRYRVQVTTSSCASCERSPWAKRRSGWRDGKPPRLLPEFGEWTSGCSSLGPPGRIARPRSTGAPPSPQPRCPRSASARDNRDSARSAGARAVARGGTGGPADPGAFAAWRRAAFSPRQHLLEFLVSEAVFDLQRHRQHRVLRSVAP